MYYVYQRNVYNTLDNQVLKSNSLPIHMSSRYQQFSKVIAEGLYERFPASPLGFYLQYQWAVLSLLQNTIHTSFNFTSIPYREIKLFDRPYIIYNSLERDGTLRIQYLYIPRHWDGWEKWYEHEEYLAGKSQSGVISPNWIMGCVSLFNHYYRPKIKMLLHKRSDFDPTNQMPPLFGDSSTEPTRMSYDTSKNSPGVVAMIKRYLNAQNRWKEAGSPIRTTEEIKKVFAICQQCEHIEKDLLGYKCGICKCRLRGEGTQINKIAMATESCPLPEPKWVASNTQQPQP